MITPEMFQWLMNNPQQMNQQIGAFQQQMAQMDPRAIVQQKLQSGEMSQQQFEQLRMMANRITGAQH